MRLFRAHGLGNDYLLVEDGPPMTAELVRALCHRHTGVGSDGVLEPGHGTLRIWNPDGSEAEKSGNGLRIWAWWAARRGAISPMAVETKGGRVVCHVQGERVRVEMGVARIGVEAVLAGTPCRRVDLGNPHAVVEGIPHDWRQLGPAIEASVPGRTNVQFCVTTGPNRVEARIWERGAGETMSSGSSACAIAASSVFAGHVVSPVSVDMPGGTAVVHVGDDFRVMLDAPVEPIGVIEVDGAWLIRRS